MITIYSKEGCPKCKVLKMKLEQKGIPYEECKDVQTMLDMGMQSLPHMSVDGRLMDFTEAVRYVNEI